MDCKQREEHARIMGGMNKDVMDFLTKKDRKKLSRLDKEDIKIFEEMTAKILYAFKVEFDMIEKHYMQETQDMMIIAMAYTLKYVCGFGKKRLPEVMYHVWNTIEMLNNGELKVEELVKELDECGIIVETRSLEYQHLFDDLKKEKEEHTL